MKVGRPKRLREKRRRDLILAPLFMYFFFSLPPEPALCKLGWPGGLFVLPRCSLQSSGLPLFYFLGTFPFFVFQPPPLRTLFLYSNYLSYLILHIIMYMFQCYSLNSTLYFNVTVVFYLNKSFSLKPVFCLSNVKPTFSVSPRSST